MSATDAPIAWRLPGVPGEEALAAARLAPPGFVTRTRALEGMQKEAVVTDEARRIAWRLLCDEGPWLNGTDLAPFPLGYFAAGLAACLLGDYMEAVRDAGEPCEGLGLDLGVTFTMEGSILRGTMSAGVESIRLRPAGPEAPGHGHAALLGRALAERSAVNAVLGAHLPGRFRLVVNGEPAEWAGLAADALRHAADPAEGFRSLRPPEGAEAGEPLVRKAETGPSGGDGAAVGLQKDQKRQVHIASTARLRGDGLLEIEARCVQPAGSRFVLLAARDDEDQRAPAGGVYLSAGVAFCFMTQLGRYAEIRKLSLDGYRIVQRTAFCRQKPGPVETAVFLDSGDSVENNCTMVRMGEQTCYVHTTLREPQTVDIQSAEPESRASP